MPCGLVADLIPPLQDVSSPAMPRLSDWSESLTEQASYNAGADEYALASVDPSETPNDYCAHSEPALAFDSPIA